MIDTIVDEADALAAGQDNQKPPATDRSAGHPLTSGRDQENRPGVLSDRLGSTSPVGDAPKRPGGHSPAGKEPR
jgi:hypothetical protein